MELNKIANSLVKTEGESKTKIKELVLYKLSNTYCKASVVMPPAICFILNGEKNIYLGEKKYIYNKNNYLLGSANLPIQSELKNVSTTNPYVGIIVYINEKILSDLLLSVSDDIIFLQNKSNFINIAPMNLKINDILIRLLEISDDPLKIRLFKDSLLKELYYYVLINDNGNLLYNCIKEHKNSQKITIVIKYIEKNFKEDIGILELAKLINISKSSLHEYFKKETGLSPIQFLKKIRLDYAYKLLFNGTKPGTAAIESGYNSQAQFSREFKKVYGISPKNVKV